MTTTSRPRAGRERAMRPRARRAWPTVAGLVALSLVPLAAGVLRLVQLAGGPDLVPADPRFATSAVPLVAHVVSSLVFALAGAVQFVPRLRRRGHPWHRRAGRVVAAAGLVAALSALWITALYPYRQGTGEVLFGLRLVFATAMTASIVLGVAAIRRRDVRAHRAWMIRGYAIGMAAGTQAFTEGFSGALFGSGVLRDDLAKGLGWVLNLAVAEWVIRRAPRHRGVAVAVQGGAT